MDIQKQYAGSSNCFMNGCRFASKEHGVLDYKKVIEKLPQSYNVRVVYFNRTNIMLKQ